MARRNQYEHFYAQIETLLQQPLATLEPGDCRRLSANGFMDLVVEVLPPCEQTGAMVLSMAHYFIQNGDLCQDPEMTLRLFHPGSTAHLKIVSSTRDDLGRAEALTLQRAIPPLYQEVYPQPGLIVLMLRRDLHLFLHAWLNNLEAQGHQLVEPNS